MYLESSMQSMTVEEREEAFTDVARLLDSTAFEAMIEGNRKFAIFSKNMAEAIRLNADELAREDARHAQRVMQQATDLIRHFETVHPYRMRSHSVH